RTPGGRLPQQGARLHAADQGTDGQDPPAQPLSQVERAHPRGGGPEGQRARVINFGGCPRATSRVTALSRQTPLPVTVSNAVPEFLERAQRLAFSRDSVRRLPSPTVRMRLARRLSWCLAACLAVAVPRPAPATSLIPLEDRELYRRADVVGHGVVVSSTVLADEAGRPQTVSVVQRVGLCYGDLAGKLVLPQ